MKLDAAQVTAGRGDAGIWRVRRGQRGTDPWLAGLAEESGSGEIETDGEQKEARANVRDVIAAMPPLAAMCFILSRAASRGQGRCIGLRDESVAFFHAKIEEDVLVRPPRNMRKDKTVWKLLKAMYGTQVASRWQRLVRVTLRDGCWTVLTSVPCVAYNEKEESSVMFHGDGFFWLRVTTVSLDKLDEVLGEIKRLPRIGPTAGRDCVFLHRTIRWSESGFSYRPDPKHVDALIETLSLTDARPVATPFALDTRKGQASNTLV